MNILGITSGIHGKQNQTYLKLFDMKNINENNLNRLAIGIIQKYKCSYERALEILESFTLNLICGERIKSSPSLQAALLTAANTGKRAFLGGVFIQLPENVKCLVPWSKSLSLTEILKEMGCEVSGSNPSANFTLNFGLPGDIEQNSLEIICNAWQGGFLSCPSDRNLLPENESMNLGGILAGSLGVSQAFLRISGIEISAGDVSSGVSLWRPDLHWYNQESQGPMVDSLPKNFWLLGLGHLGQAYLWNIGLLGYNTPQEVQILLQDFDVITEGNFSAGLLCEENNVRKYKTRICSEWLEDRGFRTKISERKFDGNTIRVEGEPYLALCGFDNAKARSFLAGAGFDLIIEAALGDSLSNFDNIILHTFPDASKTPEDLWGKDLDEKEISMTIYEAFKNDDEECGILATTLAKKALSASFVGAFAGALTIAEVIRGLYGGQRFEILVSKLRSVKNTRSAKLKIFDVELGRNGFIKNTLIVKGD
jgi:hypothetical protein